MKMKFFVLGLVLMFPFTAFGDEKAELAREIMELTNADAMMQQVKEQVLKIQDQVMAQMDIPESQKEEALQFQERIHAKIFEIMNFDNMQNEYIELYTSVYTLEELKGMIGFYKSAVGKSMLAKQPIVVKKAMEMTQNKMDALIPELKKITAEFEQSLREK